jgi:hypothetical protein
MNPVTGNFGLKDQPDGMFGARFAVQKEDLDFGVLTGQQMAQGGVAPDNLGLPVRNVTGLTINAGRLVYVSGWDLATGLPRISPASAAAQNTSAQWVTLAAIPNNATATVGKHFSLTGQDTSLAAAVGLPVYLSTLGNGSYTIPTTPSTVLGTGSQVQQVVGRVAVKDAAVGVVDFDLITGAVPMTTTRDGATLPQVGTAAGPYYSYISVPAGGVVLSASAVFPGALGINGTNYVILSIVNLLSGGGSALVTSAAALPVNSTFTAGTAIVQDLAFPLVLNATPANLVVGAGDQLKCAATVVGTLGSAIPAGGKISIGLLQL